MSYSGIECRRDEGFQFASTRKLFGFGCFEVEIRRREFSAALIEIGIERGGALLTRKQN